MGKEKQHKGILHFDSTDILFFIYEKRIPLIVISSIAAIFSIIISYTITPLFRSTVVMFPATNTSISRDLISESYFGSGSIYEIGTEEQAEHLLQILKSEEIKSRIIQKYDLMKHYKIDPDSKFPYTKLQSRYKKNIRFRFTEYMSVLIEVFDKDPQMAADIANEIAALSDTVYNRMLKQRSYEAFLLVKKEYEDMEQNIKSIRDSLDFIRKMGVNNYETQAERYYEAYGKALLDGNTNAVSVLEQKLNSISRYGGAYVSMSYMEEYELERFSKIKQKYAEARLEMEQTLPCKFIVDKAFKAEKKAYPKRSVIVIISTLSAFLVGLIMLIIADQFKSKTKV